MASLQITLTNTTHGTLEIADDEGHSLHLPREKANSLILSARMHTVTEFTAALPHFITDPVLLAGVQKLLDRSEVSWQTKEKFARLQTLTRDYQPEGNAEVIEQISLCATHLS